MYMYMYIHVHVHVVQMTINMSIMSILCLWNIQLTFDSVGIEPHGTYPRKYDLTAVSMYRNFKFFSDIFCGRSGKVNMDG